MDVVQYLLLYLVLGACAGVLAGLFGVGGGLIIVPVLVFSFAAQGFAPEVLTHLAVGTSLATIIFTSINAVLEHQRKGAVRWELVRWMTVGILLGAGIGALTAAAIQMALELKPKAGAAVPGPLGLSVAGAVIGWASAIFGIGGGSLSVPFLTWRSVPMQHAVATSSACGLPIAAASALSFILVGWDNPQVPEWSLGFVYLPAMAGIAITSMFFARFGARLAHKLSPRLLKRLFALLLFSVGLSFLL
ncbi:MAG: hypothetical protein CFE49_04410 [Pseudomonas sp. PGPPP3]|nr:MAG: hypothetical protein CFE49_04410 [Pseudomonas sp. PGPPP3]